MSALGNIIKKELKELMTPATFLPIIILALIFGSMGNTIGGIEEQMEEKPVIGLINLDNDTYSNLAENIFENTSDIKFKSGDITDKTEAINTLKEKDGVALVLIEKNFSEKIKSGKPGNLEIYWIMKGAGILDSISSSVLEQIVSQVDTTITQTLIKQKNTTINTTTALNPTNKTVITSFKGHDFPGLSPGDISGMLSTQSTFIPIIMMMIIIMAGQLVISSMALEKENKTLETLLTLPVKRTSIVTGKIAASAIIGLILALIYMFGMGSFLSTFNVEGAAEASGISFSLSYFDLLLIGTLVFITLVAALAFCMFLGTLAKNFKSAQTLSFPVAILVLIPMFLTMFKDFDTLPMALKAVIFGIPFSHPMMAPRALLFDDYLMVISGIIYVSIFAIIMIAVVVWVFKTDRIVTGSTSSFWKKILKK